MALDWTTVRREHVAQACELFLRGQTKPRAPAKGIFILYQGIRLPAKHVLRVAYCLANSLSLESRLRFSSGEGTVNMLRKLGFEVERIGESS